MRIPSAPRKQILFAALLGLLLSQFAMTSLAQVEQAVNEPLGVTVTVENPSDEALEYSVTLLVNGTLVASRPLLVEAGSSVRVNLTWVPSSEGFYELVVLVSTEGRLMKREAYSVTAVGFPDLEIESVRVTPPYYSPGTALRVGVTIRNSGTGRSGATDISLVGRSGELARKEVPPIPPGGTYETEFTIIVSESQINGFQIKLDPDDLVKEANESNLWEVVLKQSTHTEGPTPPASMGPPTPIPLNYTSTVLPTAPSQVESPETESSVPSITKSAETPISEVTNVSWLIIASVTLSAGLALAYLYMRREARGCCLDWGFEKGRGIDVLVPEELIVPYGGVLPLTASAADLDLVVIRCFRCGGGEPSESLKVPIPDELRFEWELISGRGSLVSAPGGPESPGGARVSQSFVGISKCGPWVYSSSPIAEGPSVIYVAPPPPECSGKDRRAGEERARIELRVFDLEGKVERLDDRGEKGRGTAREIRVRIVDSALREGVEVRGHAPISAIDLTRKRYAEELLDEGSDLRRGLDDWWKGVLDEARMKEELSKGMREVGRELKSILESLIKLRDPYRVGAYPPDTLDWSLRHGSFGADGLREGIGGVRKRTRELLRRIDHLREKKREIEELREKLEEKWAVISENMKPFVGKGPCAASFKWLNERPLVGEVIYPRQWVHRASGDGGQPFELRTVPVLEVPDEGRAEEALPSVELRPGQPILLRSVGKDVDRLRMKCFGGYFRDLLLDDPPVFRWRARWIGKPELALKGIANNFPLGGALDHSRKAIDCARRLRELFNTASERGVDVNLVREAKALLRENREFEWLARETEGLLKQGDDKSRVLARIDSIERDLSAIKSILEDLEDLKSSIESLAQSLYELSPSGSFLGNGGSTAVFRAPHAEGVMELACDIYDSGMQYPDGGLTVRRYVAISGSPPWFGYLNSMEAVLKDLAKIETLLESSSWAEVGSLWEVLEYLCYREGLRGLKRALVIPLSSQERNLRDLLEPLDEDLEGMLRDVEGTISRIFSDLSVKDAVYLLLKLLNLLDSELFVLKVTMSLREAISWVFFIAPLLVPFLSELISASSLVKVIYGAGEKLFAAYDMVLSDTMTIEGTPSIIAELLGDASRALRDLESAKRDADRLTAVRIAALLREYGRAGHEERKELVSRAVNEVAASLLSYLSIYLAGRSAMRRLYDERCEGAKRLDPASEVVRLVTLAVKALVRGEESSGALKELGLDELSLARSDAVSKVAKRLIEEADRIAKEMTSGPGIYQMLEERAIRGLEADLLLSSMA